MADLWPFTFIRHGIGVSNHLGLVVAAVDPSVSLKSLAKTLSGQPFALSVRVEGPVLKASSRTFKKTFDRMPPRAVAGVDEKNLSVDDRHASGIHAELDRVLRMTHDQTPLAVVARSTAVSEPSKWHAWSLGQLEPVLEKLERLIAVPGGPYVKTPLRLSLSNGSRDQHRIFLEALDGQALLAEVVQAVLSAFTVSAKTKKSRAVLGDVLHERLPALLGFDFAVDIALRDQLTSSLRVSRDGFAMPPSFAQAMSATMEAAHRSLTGRPKSDDALWHTVEAVRAAIEANALDRLQQNFDESDQRHTATLLGLSDAERLRLSKWRALALPVANAATLLLGRGRFADALTLYDAAVEGRLPAAAAANPLYAVQDDNSHLGVNAERARRYLAKCLPFGPENPAIFLNAAGVCVELGEFDEAVRLLGLAKAHKYPVKQSKNDRLFEPLRTRADYLKIMQ